MSEGGSPSGLDHLFRREHGRMVAAVARIFGLHNLKLAEDVVQDAFCRALETWKLRGVPENPSAWLMTAAKNRALDAVRRERTARRFAPELDRLLRSEWTAAPVIAEQFGARAIRDDLLRMMFSCCHPEIPEEAQVALILNILCGFSAGEIAAAFVSARAAIEKRIVRGKKVLAGAGTLFDAADSAGFDERLPAVRRALYLLFNEGYHGACRETALRGELCGEAIRLTRELLAHPAGAAPESYALCALMCLNAARIAGRQDSEGNLVPLTMQDRSQWDRGLIEQGRRLLELSADGETISPYHVEAAIAALHANAPSTEETGWREVVELYDLLMRMRPSPVVALNRAIAAGQCDGPRRGLDELQAIGNREVLAGYPFYPAALAEFELRLGDAESAQAHFREAIAAARNPEERRYFTRRLEAAAAGGN